MTVLQRPRAAGFGLSDTAVQAAPSVGHGLQLLVWRHCDEGDLLCQ